MPWSLKRFHGTRDIHFITFSCYHRKPLLQPAFVKRSFENELERLRFKYQFQIFGYVLMPEHVHMLISEPEIGTLAVVIQVLKQNVSRKMHEPDGAQFWQSRYYDFKVRTEKKFVEKLRYMHRDPVARGVVANPEDWEWSTYRHFSEGAKYAVEISRWSSVQADVASSEVKHPTLPK